MFERKREKQSPEGSSKAAIPPRDANIDAARAAKQQELDEIIAKAKKDPAFAKKMLDHYSRNAVKAADALDILQRQIKIKSDKVSESKTELANAPNEFLASYEQRTARIHEASLEQLQSRFEAQKKVLNANLSMVEILRTLCPVAAPSNPADGNGAKQQGTGVWGLLTKIATALRLRKDKPDK